MRAEIIFMKPRRYSHRREGEEGRVKEKGKEGGRRMGKGKQRRGKGQRRKREGYTPWIKLS
jgi:hypothetical protein